MSIYNSQDSARSALEIADRILEKFVTRDKSASRGLTKLEADRLRRAGLIQLPPRNLAQPTRPKAKIGGTPHGHVTRLAGQLITQGRDREPLRALANEFRVNENSLGTAFATQRKRLRRGLPLSDGDQNRPGKPMDPKLSAALADVLARKELPHGTLKRVAEQYGVTYSSLFDRLTKARAERINRAA